MLGLLLKFYSIIDPLILAVKQCSYSDSGISLFSIKSSFDWLWNENFLRRESPKFCSMLVFIDFSSIMDFFEWFMSLVSVLNFKNNVFFNTLLFRFRVILGFLKGNDPGNFWGCVSVFSTILCLIHSWFAFAGKHGSLSAQIILFSATDLLKNLISLALIEFSISFKGWIMVVNGHFPFHN